MAVQADSSKFVSPQEKGNNNAQWWQAQVMSTLGSDRWMRVGLRQLSGMLVMVFALSSLSVRSWSHAQYPSCSCNNCCILPACCCSSNMHHAAHVLSPNVMLHGPLCRASTVLWQKACCCCFPKGFMQQTPLKAHSQVLMQPPFASSAPAF